MIAHRTETDKAHDLLPLVAELRDYVHHAAQAGLTAHQVERALWTRLLALGHQALGLFFALQGSGDLGDSLQLPDGHDVQRLPQTHSRPYRSVFGDFTLDRAVYGSREGQKIEFVPLDARLQLPDSDYSYLLQEWDQTLGCEFAFARVGTTLFDILGLKQSTDSLERLNRQMAQQIEPFRESRPQLAAADEGEVMVVQADAKGIPMRRAADCAPILEHARKGPKPDAKRMAVVGAIYSVGRCERSAQEVIASLFRDPRNPCVAQPKRPEPVGKHLWASLSHEHEDGLSLTGTAEIFFWLEDELATRNPQQVRETVYLMDGQESLWEARRDYLPGTNAVEILDLLHVTPRLWQAAHLFHKERSPEAVAFVRQRLEQILRGRVGSVVGGLRQMGTKRGLRGTKAKSLSVLCGYLQKNASRMRYDEYLSRGYPIASGVIEGACRHYVKDRMERAGMHWTKAGAQAMLDVRSEYLNGAWEEFGQYRIDQETQRLYPQRQLLDNVQWTLAL